jgi:hypothetical protein
MTHNQRLSNSHSSAMIDFDELATMESALFEITIKYVVFYTN